ncbi:hypothetical protein [Neobacillus drentensis]|jgi:hypothetical protein|uniref:hypothetical protein n=1 Tax=Neobacillus drentensis TaxID=220684 RepID=UPI002FFDACB4
MIWLFILSPIIILAPIAMYFDSKKGASNPKVDIEKYRADTNLAMSEYIFITGGGDGPGNIQ